MIRKEFDKSVLERSMMTAAAIGAAGVIVGGGAIPTLAATTSGA
jgi:hypothetical protein